LIAPNDIDRWIILTFLSGRSDQLQPVRQRLPTPRLTYTTSTAATIEWTMIRLLLNYFIHSPLPKRKKKSGKSLPQNNNQI
jgi:hypothetical protein